MDNASNNDTAVQALGESHTFNYHDRRLRCSPHIIHLTVIAMLYGSGTKRTHLEHIITGVGDTDFEDSDDNNNNSNDTTDLTDLADNDENADLVKMLRSLSPDCESHSCTAADSSLTLRRRLKLKLLVLRRALQKSPLIPTAGMAPLTSYITSVCNSPKASNSSSSSGMPNSHWIP
jgi:hypothetical protein